MTSFDGWRVSEIPSTHTYEWLLHRHYAKAIPPISRAYGLFRDALCIGVCTFGPPPRMFNDGFGLFGGQLEIDTYELNRLCIAPDLPENALSWFLSRVLKAFPGPAALVSYADTNWGHHGYIYQATNWLYCGTSLSKRKFVDRKTGKQVHARTVVSRYGSQAHPDVAKDLRFDEQTEKHRYVYFVGSRKEKRLMREALAYDVLPYPKGENDRYEDNSLASERSSLIEILNG